MNHHQRSIDGLRGIAILLVIMFHRDIAYFGWTGVILFFVLSGYLITKVLFTEKEKTLSLGSKFRNFWMRRVLRIFPLCYLYLLILLLGLLVKMISSDVANELPWLFTYTYNFYLISVYDSHIPSFLAGHFWSLAIEEQFYLFYPFIVFLCSRKQLKFAVTGLIVFSILFRFLFSVQNGDDVVYDFSASVDYHPFAYMDSFLAGAALFIFRLDKIKPLVGYLSFIVSFFLTMIGGFFVYLNLVTDYRVNILDYLSNLGIVAHYCDDYYCVWMHVCLNFLFSSVLLLLLLPVRNSIHRWFKKFFELPPLVAIGKVSYGMYVFHAIIIWALMGTFDYQQMNKYLFFLLCLSGTWVVSFIVYHVYEKRFLALKEKFR